MAKFAFVRAARRGIARALYPHFGWKRSKACYWCGRRVRYGMGSHNLPNQATREHLKPRSLGGRNGKDNIVVACRQCNTDRGREETWIPHHEQLNREIRPDLVQWGVTTTKGERGE